MTLSYEKYLDNLIKNQSHRKSIQAFTENGLIVTKTDGKIQSFYIIGIDHGKLLLLNVNKLPNFEKTFVINFLFQEKNPKTDYFLNFLKRNTVKKAIEHHDPQKIKNFWIISQITNKENQ